MVIFRCLQNGGHLLSASLNHLQRAFGGIYHSENVVGINAAISIRCKF